MTNYVEYSAVSPPTKEQFNEIYLLMEQSFPPGERRSHTEQQALFEDPHYRIIACLEEDGKLSGFFSVWIYESFRFGEHLAVNRELRCAGIGGALLDYVISSDNKPFLLEVEPPDTELADRRITFYKRHGFCLNPFEYWQPPLGHNGFPLPLLLMSFPQPLKEKEFEQYRDFLYRYLYRWNGSIEDLKNFLK